MDVLWFRLSRAGRSATSPLGRFDAGRIFVMLNRGDYWQCALRHPEGRDSTRCSARGLEAFRAGSRASAPFLADRVDELDAGTT